MGKHVRLIAGVTIVAGAMLWLATSKHAAPKIKNEDLGLSDKIVGFVNAHGMPVAGATVRVQGTPTSTTSDTRGRFELRNPQFAKSVTVTASKAGYFISSAEAHLGKARSQTRIELEPLPGDDNPDYCWVDPTPDDLEAERCGNCHQQIYAEWKSSEHSRSLDDRRFRSLVEGTDWHGKRNVGWNLTKDHPHGVSVCDSCHAPTRDTEFGGTQNAGLANDGLAHESPINTTVHCDFCHKISDVSTHNLGTTHGRFAFDLLRPTRGQLFFGPLDDVDRGEDVFSPLQRKSQLCAPCHEGIVFGVPVYTTYSEWLASPAAKAGRQCQDCHMAPTGAMTNIAVGHGGLERIPSSLASHSFMPEGREAMLQNCLTVETEFQHQHDSIEFQVSVQATDVGHRVPTGFIDRHLILVVEALDDQEQHVTLIEGPTLPLAAGTLHQQPGHLFAKLLVDPSGTGPQPFWRAGMTTNDTRLMPDQAEHFTFRFPQETATIKTKLVYRPFWETVAQQKGWPTEDLSVFAKTTKVNRPIRTSH